MATLEPTSQEDINLNDDDEDIFASENTTDNSKENQKTVENDDDDDFFDNLGGKNRPNPSTLVSNTQVYQNTQASQNNTTNYPENVEKSQENNSLSPDLKHANLTRGDDEPVDINISVTDPRKIGDSLLDSYITFRVRTVLTQGSKLQETFGNNSESIVDRRFSDFLGIFERLKGKYQHKGILVPAPPEKDVKSLAKIRVSNSENEAVELNAVSRRQAALERFLNRIAAHPVLQKDEHFIAFLMQPTLQSSKSQTSVFSLNGMKKIFNKAEDQVQKLTKPYIEQDAWFDDKTNSVERVHQQYQQLFLICTQLYRNRRELGESFAGLSSELCGLVQLEKSHDKSGYMTDLCQKLGNTYASVQSNVNQQQKIDCFDLAEIIGDHVRILESVKDLLFVRVKAFQGCQQAEESLYNKQQQKNRFEAEAKFDKIPKLEFEINELKKSVEMAKENFVTLSNTIKQEISVYNKVKILNLFILLQNYFLKLVA